MSKSDAEYLAEAMREVSELLGESPPQMDIGEPPPPPMDNGWVRTSVPGMDFCFVDGSYRFGTTRFSREPLVLSDAPAQASSEGRASSEETP